LDWRWLLFGLGAIAFAALFYAWMGWMRERFDLLNPHDVDHETLWFDRTLGTVSLRALRAVAKAFSRHSG
jgi:hypothetical protein